MGNVATHVDKLRYVKEEYANYIRAGTREGRAKAGLPVTDTEFSERFGVTRQTLRNWRNDNDFKKMVTEPVLSQFSAADIMKVMHAMMAKAQTGNVQAARLVLDMAGISPKFNETVNPTMDDMVNQVSELTDAELELMIAEDEDGN